jgi:ferrous iron transport protein B
LRILEEDEDFHQYLKNEEIAKEIEDDLKKTHSNAAEDISITRYGTASFITEKVINISRLQGKKKWQDNIDNFLLHKFWGPAINGLLILGLFGLLLFLGSLAQNCLMDVTEKFLHSLSMPENNIIPVILNRGLTGLAAGISIALPYVFLFYLILGLLEDIGILSRFIVNAQRLLEKVNLPGKSFIPLALALGCTAPATRATRILASKKQQFYTASFFTCVPCSSRIAIIMGIVGFYAGGWIAFFVFATLLAAGSIWALVIQQIVHIENEPLLLELPPYRKPLIKNILTKSWIRMKDFVYIVIPFLIVGGILYGILDLSGTTNMIVNPFRPITTWLNLPPVTIIPLLFGFLQKDLTGAMLVSVLGSDISSVLTTAQIYTFGLAATIGIPCIIAYGMLWKEFGFKKTTLLTFISIIYGFLIAGLAWRIIFILH